VNETANSLLWWVIPGVLAGMPMPFIHWERRMNHGAPLAAYDDDLPILHSAGIRAVVCLLNIPTDEPVYRAAGFDFLCLPIADGAAPVTDQVTQFVQFVSNQRQHQRPVAVHCEAGFGRTGTMIAAYLISQGDTALGAIGRVREIERVAVETREQILFLEQYARATDRGNRD
jgi:atypical dual specificity phosphatase